MAIKASSSGWPLERGLEAGNAKRIASVVGGAALTVYGLSRESLGGMLLAAVGGGLVFRGLAGCCSLSSQQRSGQASVAAGEGVRVDQTIRVSQPPEVVYRFWRNLENLPRFMRHLESVTERDHHRSHWVARAPAGRVVEWDARIIEDRPNEMISWQSLGHADVDNAGSVHFQRAGTHGTDVRVELKYNPPGGRLGSFLAYLLGEEPNQQIAADLRRFKSLVEASAPMRV